MCPHTTHTDCTCVRRHIQQSVSGSMSGEDTYIDTYIGVVNCSTRRASEGSYGHVAEFDEDTYIAIV